MMDRVLTFDAKRLNRYLKKRFPLVARKFRGPQVALHSWRPGVVELSDQDAQSLARARRGDRISKLARGRLEDALAAFAGDDGVDCERLIERPGAYFPSIQHYGEMQTFLRIIAEHTPRTVLEIGTAAGGMLYSLCQVAAPDAIVISLDIGDGGAFGGGQSIDECELFRGFARGRQRMEFIRGSSLSSQSVRRLEEILDGRKVDLLFIDGDHHYGAVRSDFEIYRRYIAADGLVALHDVNVRPELHGEGMEVGVLWRELEGAHRTLTISSAEGARSNEEFHRRIRAALPRSPHLIELFAAGLSLAEVVAVLAGSRFVRAPRFPRFDVAAPFESIGTMPAQLQMAWGIGVVALGRARLPGVVHA